MILKGIYLAMDFHGPEGRTPPRGWRRAGDSLTGGAEIETPPRGWRRAEDAIPGGVNARNYRFTTSHCQGLPREGQGL